MTLEVVHQSEFLEIQDAADRIMAERGFPIQNDLILRQCILEIPPSSSSGQEQMTKAKVLQTKKVANIRIHVERAINRVKWFSILGHTLTISLIPLMDPLCASDGITLRFRIHTGDKDRYLFVDVNSGGEFLSSEQIFLCLVGGTLF